MQTMWAITTVVAMLGGGDEDLEKATKKAGEMTNYTFKVNASIDNGKGAKPTTVDGMYVKDQPISLKGAKTEAFKKGDVMVVKEGEEWKKAEAPQKGQKGGKGGAAIGLLKNLKNPHEELAGFEKKFKEAKKADQKENDCTVYSGDLTDEAAKELGSAGGKAGGKAEMTYSGSAKVWINGEGSIVKYEIVVKTKGKVKDKDVDITVSKTVEISAVGSTKIEVPDGAKKVLEGQP